LDEAEVAIVSQMFEWYLEPSVTLYRVAKRLTNLGLPTPMGKSRWSVSTVRSILMNHTYTGTVYANRLRTVPAKRRLSALRPIGKGESSIQRPKEEWIPIPVPSVVTQETFDQVQTKMSLNQQKAPRNNKAHQYLLRSLVSCGKCRLSAHARTLHNGKYHYYVCKGHTDALRKAPGERCKSRYVPVSQLDELVWQDLCEVLTKPKIIAYELERAHGGHWAPQELQARIDTLSQAESLLKHQQERLLEAYLASVIDLEEFERKRSELIRKQDALATQRLQLGMTFVERAELSGLATSIEEFCSMVRPMLEYATFAQRRQLVELLIDRVVVTENRVEIRYVIPTQPDGPHVPFCHLRTNHQ
jgi:site-specific DNA recombinase